MATKLIPKQFKISADVWDSFQSACESAGTYPSAVLRDFCEAYGSDSAEVLELHDALQVELELEHRLSMESDLKEIIFKVGELYSGPGGRTRRRQGGNQNC